MSKRLIKIFNDARDGMFNKNLIDLSMGLYIIGFVALTLGDHGVSMYQALSLIGPFGLLIGSRTISSASEVTKRITRQGELRDILDGRPIGGKEVHVDAMIEEGCVTFIIFDDAPQNLNPFDQQLNFEESDEDIIEVDRDDDMLIIKMEEDGENPYELYLKLASLFE